MTFSEILNMLFPYCGKGKTISDFVKEVVDNIIEEAEGDTVYNPLYELVPRTIEKYFKGESLSVKNATQILGHLDKEKFRTYMDGFSTDAWAALLKKLSDYGIHVNVTDVPIKIADLIERALTEITLRGRKNSSKKKETEIIKNPISTLRQITPPLKIDEKEIPYVEKLMEAYGEAEGISNFDKITFEDYRDKYGEHFNRQRKDFYAAESVRQGTREAYGETNQFEVLKEETYDGIIDVWEQKHKDGLTRLANVLSQASKIRIDRCKLCRETDWIGNSQKKGVCHVLVNDGKLEGWVKNEK